MKKYFITLCILFFSNLTLLAIAENNTLLIQRTTQPWQAEASYPALEPWLTPIDGFFVRSHYPTPNIDSKTYVITIDGLVDKPLTLSLADLQKMRQVSIYAVLACAGNARGLQRPIVPGIQWKHGAVGNAKWTGVPLADILKLAGVKKNAKFLRLEGADKPILPTSPVFARNITLQKAMMPDTLLALKMNDESPTIHGFPVRVIVPNWYGESWMKWVTHITVTAEEDQGFFMKKAYRVPKQEVKPGEAWDVATGVRIENVRVQSIIVTPNEGNIFAPGDINITGKAFSGTGAISKVEISTDEGKTWQLAKLDDTHPIVESSWRIFSATVKASALGPFTLLSRATDANGNQQPMTPVWNPKGYVYNTVDRVDLEIVAPAVIAGRTLLLQRCVICHSKDFIESQRLTEAQWQGEINKMLALGATLTPAESATLMQYLKRFKN